MHVKQLGRYWWILGDPDDYGPMGPYDTKREAEEGKRGLVRFYARQHELELISANTNRKRGRDGNDAV